MKPQIEKFKKVSDATGGNITTIARYFEVTRVAVYKWLKSEEFKAVIDNSRGVFFDECFETALLLAFGVPELNDKGRLIGWIERPDTRMLIYLIDRLGRAEGFGRSVNIGKNNVECKNNVVLIFNDARVLTKPEYKEFLSENLELVK